MTDEYQEDTRNRHFEAVLTLVDFVTEPKKMSKAEALEFIDDMIEELKSRCETLRDELQNEGDGP